MTTEDHIESNDQDELYEHFSTVVDPGQQPMRLDKFLCDRMANTSRSRIQNAAKNGNVQVNGEVVKPSYQVKPGDAINFLLPWPVREVELIPQDIPLEILFEDEHIVILNKQADLVVHPGHGNWDGTLVNALLHHFGELPMAAGQQEPRPGLVHRLDKDTTGVMVIGKTDHALTHLSKQFFDRTSDRRYNALVWGDFDEQEGTIEGNIGRSLRDRKVMQVFTDGEEGKHAVTHWKVLEHFTYVSLIECKLETGRTHQIRAHMAWQNHPVFNDAAYGGDRIRKGTTFSKYKQFVENCFKLLPRQALHAKSLEIEHPHTGERMRFESDLPDDMQQALHKWRGYAEAKPLE